MAHEMDYSHLVNEKKPEPQEPAYAGFWVRLAAYMIDSIIIGISAAFILVPILFSLGQERMEQLKQELENPDMSGASGTLLGISFILSFFVMLYHGIFESSAWQATPGKKVVGLAVTNEEGGIISLDRALLRSMPIAFAVGFSQSGSYALMAVFAMLIMAVTVGVDKRKQGIHDRFTGCLIVRRWHAV